LYPFLQGKRIGPYPQWFVLRLAIGALCPSYSKHRHHLQVSVASVLDERLRLPALAFFSTATTCANPPQACRAGLRATYLYARLGIDNQFSSSPLLQCGLPADLSGFEYCCGHLRLRLRHSTCGEQPKCLLGFAQP